MIGKKLIDNKKGYTDKDTTHSYLPLYEKILNPIVSKAKNVLEIGTGDFKENGATDVKNGGSIWLWLDFFEKAQIYGIDILSKESVMDELHDEERFSFFGNTNAYDSNFVTRNFIRKNIKFDLIIDDGPHTLESMIDCIKLYHDLLTENGIMIIEDVQKIRWFDKLSNATPSHLQSFIKTYDLRENKGRWDDLVFTIDKLN